MELGRVILLVRGERFSIVRVNWLTKIFVAGDVLSFLMQASGEFDSTLFHIHRLVRFDLMWGGVDWNWLNRFAMRFYRGGSKRDMTLPLLFSPSGIMTDAFYLNTGAGLMVTAASGGSSDSASTGNNVIIGGLFVQIIFFGFFLISAVVFQRRLISSQGRYASSSVEHLPWRRHMFALHTSSVLILVRSVVRVVEYVQGTDGFLMSNEVFIYCFDGLLMWVMMVIFVVMHPSEINLLLKRERMGMNGGYGVDGEPLV